MSPTPEEPDLGASSRHELEVALAVRRALLDELDWLAHRLETSNQVLERFAGSVAHDLKAPIANLVGYGELLVDSVSDLDPEKHGDLANVAARVEANARRAMDIVEELIAYARETGDPGPLHTDLDEVVAWVLDTLAEDIEQTGASIVVDSPLLPVAVNEAAARQLVANMLSNALRHTREGVAPVVRVRTESVDDSSVQVRIVDNGPGIESSRRDEVFEFGVSGLLHAGGSGIGLAASRATAADHGGRIWIEDGLDGVGTTVVLRLPAPAPGPGAVRPATVFVAHPAPELWDTVRLLGRRLGFGVVGEAATPAAALVAYGMLPERPDLVLVADHFPIDAGAAGDGSHTDDGFELAAELRVLEPDQVVIVVGRSASGDERARTGGVAAIVSIRERGALRVAIQDALRVHRP